MKKYIKFLSITLVTSILLNYLPISFLKKVETIKKVIEVNEIFDYTSYLNFFDDYSIVQADEEVYKINTVKRIDQNKLSNINNTSDLSEYENTLEDITDTIDIETEVLYNPSREYMSIDLVFVDDNQQTQELDIKAYPQILSDGSIEGTVYIDGEVHNIKDVMEISSENNIDDCFLSALAITIIVGAVIGAVIGGVGAYYAAKALKKSPTLYVIGGIFIGAVIGASVSIYAGQLGSVVFPKISALGAKITTATGFPTIEKVKAAMGGAVSGYEFHHLVGKGYNNLARFGELMIHNTKNVIQIPTELHRIVTNYYQSAHNGAYGGLRFAEYMSTKSYAEQYKIAVETLIKLAEKNGFKIFFN